MACLMKGASTFVQNVLCVRRAFSVKSHRQVTDMMREWEKLQWHPSNHLKCFNGYGVEDNDHLAGSLPIEKEMSHISPADHPDGTKNVRGTCIMTENSERLSVQESYDAGGKSFGSGLQNLHGLQLRSYRVLTPGANGKSVISSNLQSFIEFKEHHIGFPGLACGGIVGCAMETIGNWTAAIKVNLKIR